MAAARQDFIIMRGDTWSRTLSWKTHNNSGIVVPVDLTSATAWMQIRVSVDGAFIIELNTTPATGKGTIGLGGDAGTITLTLTAEQTAALTFAGCLDGGVNEGSTTGVGKVAVYDLEVTVGSEVATILSGLICLVKDITK